MANKNTRRAHKLKLNGYRVRRGHGINSTLERRNSGKKRYDAPTMQRHPISGESPMRLSF